LLIAEDLSHVNVFFDKTEQNPSSHTMALRLTQPLIGMTTRILPGGKGRLTLEADKFTTFCEPIVKKCRSINLSQHYRPPQPITGIALPFIFEKTVRTLILFICVVLLNPILENS
jgi:hypothetical protein